jgi:hypothetical protein
MIRSQISVNHQINGLHRNRLWFLKVGYYMRHHSQAYRKSVLIFHSTHAELIVHPSNCQKLTDCGRQPTESMIAHTTEANKHSPGSQTPFKLFSFLLAVRFMGSSVVSCNMSWLPKNKIQHRILINEVEPPRWHCVCIPSTWNDWRSGGYQAFEMTTKWRRNFK